MKANQKGFSVVEILIVIVIVGLLGTVGWLVYSTQPDNSQSQAATKTIRQMQKEISANNEKTSDEVPVIPGNAFDNCVLGGGNVTVSYDGSTPKERVCGDNKVAYIEFGAEGLVRDDAIYDVGSVKLTELGSDPINNCGISSPKTKEVTLTYEVEGNSCEVIRFYSKELQSANSWVACKADGISYNRGRGEDLYRVNPHTGSSSTYLDEYNRSLQDSKVKPIHLGEYYYIPVFGEGSSCLSKDVSTEIIKHANKAYQNYQKAVESLR